MATFMKRRTKHGTKWCASIRRCGMKSMARTFSSKTDALAWARQVESEFDRGFLADTKRTSKVTMSELFDRYLAATQDTKRNAPAEKFGIRLLNRHFGELYLAKLTRERIAEFRDQRLKEGKSPSTVRNNLHLLSSVIQMTINDWGYDLPYNPVHRVTKPRVDNARNRRLEGTEETQLLEAASDHKNPTMKPLIILALETAMRLGELLGLRWEHVNYENREAFLPKTKNGHQRCVPLSMRAVQALQGIEREEGSEFVFSSWRNVHSFQHAWQRLTKKAHIEGLHFHDLRHEAASRYAEQGMDVMRIAAITGHRSLQMLKRYTHFRAADLARELDERSSKKRLLEAPKV